MSPLRRRDRPSVRPSLSAVGDDDDDIGRHVMRRYRTSCADGRTKTASDVVCRWTNETWTPLSGAGRVCDAAFQTLTGYFFGWHVPTW